MRLLLLLLSLALLASLATAQVPYFTVFCQVIRADNGEPLLGALCALYNTDGSTYLSANTTDSDGMTAAGFVASGTYQLQISAADFYSASYPVTVDEVDTLQRSVLSPIVGQDAVRIILSWGEVPSDLDSWLFLPEGWPCEAVGYSNPSCTLNSSMVFLDNDDTSSYGPETITLTNLPAGVYPYKINQYSQDGSFSNSGASVNFYFGPTASPVYAVNAPPDTTNTWWHVANLVIEEDSDGCRAIWLAPVNTFSMSQSDSGASSGNTSNIYIGRVCDSSAAICATPPSLSNLPKICGVFGDPHIYKSDRTGTTCRSTGTATLVENEWFSLLMTNIEIDSSFGATATSAMSLIYRQCNPQTLIFNAESGTYPAPSNPATAGPHTITRSGNNYYLNALNTNIQIRYVGGFIVFGISTPFWNDSALCNVGCNEPIRITGRSLDRRYRETQAARKRQSSGGVSPSEAQTRCASVEDAFARESCIFDQIVTGDMSFVEHAGQIQALQQDLLASATTSTSTTATSTTLTASATVAGLVTTAQAVTSTTSTTNAISTTTTASAASTAVALSSVAVLIVGLALLL